MQGGFHANAVTSGVGGGGGAALLWLAQGKTNSDIASILGITESTVKKHIQERFEKPGVETRGAAKVRAQEALNPPENFQNSSSKSPAVRSLARATFISVPPDADSPPADPTRVCRVPRAPLRAGCAR